MTQTRDELPAGVCEEMRKSVMRRKKKSPPAEKLKQPQTATLASELQSAEGEVPMETSESGGQAEAEITQEQGEGAQEQGEGTQGPPLEFAYVPPPPNAWPRENLLLASKVIVDHLR